MTLELFFNILTQAVYLALSVITIASWTKHWSPVHRNIALLFLSLCVAMLLDDLETFFPYLRTELAVAFFMLLALQPYLLLNVAKFLEPLPKPVAAAVPIGLLIVWAGLIMSAFFPVPGTVALIV